MKPESRFSFAVGLAFLVSSIPATAQSAARARTLFEDPPAAADCPVSLRAQHLADGTLIQARSGHPRGMGQWLHLTLAGKRASPVAAATVTVHGFSGKGRLTQAAPAMNESSRKGLSTGSSDAAQDLTVRFSSTSGEAAAGDLWIPGMTAVQMIELHSVAYADGSVWRFSAPETCRVAPDPLMLIAGR
jgi:hypothetical protein